MFLIESNAVFQPMHRPNTTASVGDFLFVYQNGNIALTWNNTLPLIDKSFSDSEANHFYCFGHINDYQCWESDIKIKADFHFSDAKLSRQFLSLDTYQAVALGNHIHHWRSAHRYCGKCAAPMQDKPNERARICLACHYITYPKISPCVIMLVTRGDDMLLARSPHFLPGVMSTLAGFVEVGESVEQTLVREVKEEVGIVVNHLKYVCSQPWPFPDSLMLGFTAEYVSGEINIDNNEIEAAEWFNKDNLPILPNEMSIARYLINRHLKKINKL